MNEINIGDKVQVVLFVGERVEKAFNGIVYHIPVATGDCWRFLDEKGNLRYVQNFVQIIKNNVPTENIPIPTVYKELNN